MFDKLKEECGVFGIYNKSNIDVVMTTYIALYALQHRGQESCGIAVNDDGVVTLHKDVGLVPEVFNKDVLTKLGTGNIAVGHVRYSTTGKPEVCNCQPLLVRHVNGPMVVAHNGNLVNAFEVRNNIELRGGIFHTTSDTEVIAYTITEERLKRRTIEDAVVSAMSIIKGAYSLVIMSPQKLIAARDPNGFRPLCMGRLNDSIVFASETCALDSINAEFIRDVEPGEVVVVDKKGIRSIKTNCTEKGNICVFEYVYFARPDSVIEGVSVQEARIRAGKFLAIDSPVEADVVIGVPDSGLDAAIGYSQQSGIPYGKGLIKNRYVGRTFIQPTQGERDDLVRIKLNAISSAVKGKRVVLIDDSIVRGTTGGRIVKILRDAGATEVHLRISCPPFVNPCYFGTDIDSKDKLIACNMTIEEMTEHFGVDSLAYLSLEGVKNIAKDSKTGFCVGCFTGVYPIAVTGEVPKDKFERKISESNKTKFS